MNRIVSRTLLRAVPGLCLAALIVTAALGGAGGFYLSVERPAGDDPALRGAVLVVRPTGCHEPAKARLTATAEGIVDGKRQSRPVTLHAVGEGVYTVRQEWPAEGAWVLSLTGTYRGQTTSALVELGAGGAVVSRTAGGTDLPVHLIHGKAGRDDLASALASAQRRVAAVATTGRSR